jgi:HNH endonuclease
MVLTKRCEQRSTRKAADLLSGPGGLASFLRTRQLGARLAGPSLPLDIGYASTIPAGIRNAVILRDKRCRWAGGCHQPAAACEVHHVKHKADGGHTSTRDCVLLCWLCRRRHKKHYAELGIMPTWR